VSAKLRELSDVTVRHNRGTTELLNVCNHSNATACPLVVATRVDVADRLHDSVIQELFALALGLEGLSKQTLQLVVSIREEISGLRVDTGMSLREELALALRSFDTLAAIDIREVAPVPSSVHTDIRDVVKESVSNAIRHGKARKVVIEVRMSSRAIEVEVSDDGKGCAPVRGGVGGLGGMARRADGRGGTFRFLPNASGGMSVQWKIPNKEEMND
jgi:signal transduction histidine kinase